jgi:hypothetical protein
VPLNLFQPFKLFGPEWERRQIEKQLRAAHALG